MSESRGVYMLSPSHADAVRRLVPAHSSGEAAQEYIAARLKAREEGRAYTFVVSDGGDVVGICGLSGVDAGLPQLFLEIDPFQRGKGHATFAANHMLELAFQNLQLERIGADAPLDCPDWQRLLSRLGFQIGQGGYALTRQRWVNERTQPALRSLHPSLVPILEAELAAGNELAETRTGWPDRDSVFVRLRQPFLTRPSMLPDDVQYTESNDPHWWKAEYSSSAPRHVLASA